MLVHIRLNVPTSLTAQVRELLVDHAHVTNVVLLEGASLDPEGDLFECDVARETASQLLRTLEDIGVGEQGGIVLTTPTGTPFAAARRLERLAPGDPQDAVVWDNVIADAYAASRPTVTYHVFLVLATILASVAVITDSSVLVVGAMVVGPEFGTVAALCTGLVFARWGLAWASLRLLVLGFAFAIAVVTLLALRPGAGRGDHRRDGDPAAAADRLHLAPGHLVVRGRAGGRCGRACWRSRPTGPRRWSGCSSRSRRCRRPATWRSGSRPGRPRRSSAPRPSSASTCSAWCSPGPWCWPSSGRSGSA